MAMLYMCICCLCLCLMIKYLPSWCPMCSNTFISVRPKAVPDNMWSSNALQAEETQLPASIGGMIHIWSIFNEHIWWLEQLQYLLGVWHYRYIRQEGEFIGKYIMVRFILRDKPEMYFLYCSISALLFQFSDVICWISIFCWGLSFVSVLKSCLINCRRWERCDIPLFS